MLPTLKSPWGGGGICTHKTRCRARKGFDAKIPILTKPPIAWLLSNSSVELMGVHLPSNRAIDNALVFFLAKCLFHVRLLTVSIRPQVFKFCYDSAGLTTINNYSRQCHRADVNPFRVIQRTSRVLVHRKELPGPMLPRTRCGRSSLSHVDGSRRRPNVSHSVFIAVITRMRLECRIVDLKTNVWKSVLAKQGWCKGSILASY